MPDVPERDAPARSSGTEDTADVPAPRSTSRAEAVADAYTTQLEPPPGSVLPPGLWLFFLLFAAAGFLIGIGIAAATRPGPPGSVVAEATVGEDGASLGFGGRGVVRIPDGALRRPTRIEVRRSVVKKGLRVSPPEGPVYVFERNRLVAYTFTPASARFAAPVTIVLPLERTGRGGTAFVVSDAGVVFLSGKVDAKAGTVTIKVTDFAFGGGAQ